jgi:hypothetical protein
MLNRIAFAIKVLNAFNFILTDTEWIKECNRPKDPSEVETVIPWDWYWDDILEAEAAAAAAAPSFLMNVDDLSSFVVDGFHSIVAEVPPFGQCLLPFLSLLVGTLYLLGFRPFERLDGLSGIWRCAMAMVVLVASFLAVWTVPAVAIKPCVVALLVRVVLGLARAAWDWMWWTLHRLVDLLGCYLGVGLLVRAEVNMVTMTGLLGFWAGCRGIVYLAHSYLPMSWLRTAEQACNSLTFPLVINLRLVWWSIRNVFALLRMAVVAVCGAAVAGATGTANTVQTICGSFYKGMVQTVVRLSAVRVGDLVSVVAPGAAASMEATVLPPVAVEAAPVVETEVAAEAAPVVETEVAVEVDGAVETEVMQEVEASTVNAPVVRVVPVKARTKSKVPKGPVQPKSRRRARPAPESKVEPRRSKRVADREGR